METIALSTLVFVACCMHKNVFVIYLHHTTNTVEWILVEVTVEILRNKRPRKRRFWFLFLFSWIFWYIQVKTVDVQATYAKYHFEGLSVMWYIRSQEQGYSDFPLLFYNSFGSSSIAFHFKVKKSNFRQSIANLVLWSTFKNMQEGSEIHTEN